jgi:hypothetical protein
VLILSPSFLASDYHSNESKRTLLFRVSLKQLLSDQDSSEISYTPLDLIGLCDAREKIARTLDNG